jgi:type IV secretory pathway VirB6-like protein
MRERMNRIIRIVIITLSFFSVSACSLFPGYNVCIPRFNAVKELKSFIINADGSLKGNPNLYGQWLDPGIILDETNQFSSSMTINGQIATCKKSSSFTLAADPRLQTILLVTNQLIRDVFYTDSAKQNYDFTKSANIIAEIFNNNKNGSSIEYYAERVLLQYNQYLDVNSLQPDVKEIFIQNKAVDTYLKYYSDFYQKNDFTIYYDNKGNLIRLNIDDVIIVKTNVLTYPANPYSPDNNAVWYKKTKPNKLSENQWSVTETNSDGIGLILTSGSNIIKNENGKTNNDSIQSIFTITNNGLFGIKIKNNNVQNPIAEYGGYNISVEHTGCLAKDAKPNMLTNSGNIEVKLLDDDDKEFKKFKISEQSFVIQSINKNAKILLRVTAKDDKFENNAGYYDLKFAFENRGWLTMKISGLIYSFVIDPIKKTVKQVTRENFINLVTNNQFQVIVRTLLTLFVVIYGLLFTLGAIKDTQTMLVVKAIKIAIILALISPGSWNFFSDHLLRGAEEGMDYLIIISSGYNPYLNNIFSFSDRLFDFLLHPWNILKLFSLFFMSVPFTEVPFYLHSMAMGIILFSLIIIPVIVYLIALLFVIIEYIKSIFIIGFLISLAPLFIITILFDTTKKFFIQWATHVTFYILYPVFLFIFINFAHELVSISIYSLFAFETCFLLDAIPFKILGIWPIPIGLPGFRITDMNLLNLFGFFIGVMQLIIIVFFVKGSISIIKITIAEMVNVDSMLSGRALMGSGGMLKNQNKGKDDKKDDKKDKDDKDDGKDKKGGDTDKTDGGGDTGGAENASDSVGTASDVAGAAV